MGTFYKYKQEWAADIAEMEKERETKFAEILDSVGDGSAHATKPEPEEIHEPTMAETESFFGESTFNPEEPKKRREIM